MVEYLWVFKIIDPDGDEHITSEMNPWLCWNKLEDMCLFIRTTLVDDFNEKLDRELIHREIINVYNQVIEFEKDVKPGRENQICIVVDEDDENTTSLDLQVWTLTLQK